MIIFGKVFFMVKELQQLNDLILKELNLKLSELIQIWNVRNILALILKLMKAILNSESQN